MTSEPRATPTSTPDSPAGAPHAPQRVAPNFITEVMARDLSGGKYPRIVTRFPPEPNGYLHLGHVFACSLDFGAALDFGGRYHLRLDDTNPEGESMEFAEAIQDDLRWLGWDWGEALFYASDHFETYYRYAERLIELGRAYVDSVSGDEMARLRGSVSQAGTPSPYRSRTVAENLELFRRMRAGEFADGAHVLRAKIDLSSNNMKLRDPVLYRILRATHYRQGDQWCIYPMYDFQHPLQDALEGVTHSMCSLEFVDNRAIYDWLMETLAFDPRPHQYEFGRRSLEYTIVSKRKLRRLVQEGVVNGWDDPRMPTLRAQRRRGVTPAAMQAFAGGIGVNRTNRTVDLAVFENAVRNDLNTRAPRVMAVLEPLRVVVENLEAARLLTLPYWPHDVLDLSPDGLLALPDGSRVLPDRATREVPLTRELYIERSDFELTPPKGFKRLTPGGQVRLRGAGIIRAERFEVGEDGQPEVVYATLQPEDARASGVIHWVSAEHALPAEFRLYDRLFTVANPEGQDSVPDFDPEEPGHEDTSQPLNADFLRFLNPDSLRVTHGFVEPSVGGAPADTRYQFERQGYFWQDPQDSAEGALVYGRIITLRDTWAGRAEHGPERASAENMGAAKTGAARPARATKVGVAAGEPQAGQAPAALTPEQARRAARLAALGVSEAEASAAARDAAISGYLEGLIGEGAGDGGPDDRGPGGEGAGLVVSWAVSDLSAPLREGQPVPALAEVQALAALVADGSLSARSAREVLTEAVSSGEAPVALVERRGLRQVSDTAELERLIRRVMDEQPAKLAEYRAGKKGLSGFFTGQVMRLSGGQANPQVLAELLGRLLDGES